MLHRTLRHDFAESEGLVDNSRNLDPIVKREQRQKAADQNVAAAWSLALTLITAGWTYVQPLLRDEIIVALNNSTS